GQASSLTDLAKLRPYTGIRRVCAIANQAVESMGKWIRKSGGATLYNKWNTELVEMRGIVVRSRQKRRADEKADAIVNPQETAERRLAKRAVKVEKRKRAMKEKVQEWRGLKQRKL
ncbi:U3 snoRNP protein, partial [Perkinsus olseni]